MQDLRGERLFLSILVAGVLCATAHASPLASSFAKATADKSQGTAGRAEVADISGKKYFDVVHSELLKASNSIQVVMYLMSPASRRVETLIDDLVDAHKRGVDVKVILDHSYEYSDGKRQKESDTKNDKAFKILHWAGIDVRFTAPGRTVHDKLIIIDGRIVILGSTNWTGSALTKNSETSVLIRSAELAAQMQKNMLRLVTDGEGKKKKRGTAPPGT